MKKILLLPLLLMAMMAKAETALTVEPLNGSDKEYVVSLIGQIRFFDRVMYLYDQSGNELGHTAISEIGQIIFREATSTPTSLDNVQSNISVYPNPAVETITVNGLQDNQTIRIYDLQGRLISATPSQAGQTTVNVSNLQHGSYLLQVGAEVVKVIKN